MDFHKEKPMLRLRRLAVAALLLLPAACGSGQFDRVSTGAGTGAATGATIGLIAGPIGVGTGALIGAGAGALTGSMTSADQLDLGKPVWE
jgi:osmotically inducible lipoprotein OsmB